MTLCIPVSFPPPLPLFLSSSLSYYRVINIANNTVLLFQRYPLYRWLFPMAMAQSSGEKTPTMQSSFKMPSLLWKKTNLSEYC